LGLALYRCELHDEDTCMLTVAVLDTKSGVAKKNFLRRGLYLEQIKKTGVAFATLALM
jgi:hypothetical protein